jgi:uncharacterized protein YeaO (DUF488 family)
MDVRLKRAYDPATPADGYRVLIDRVYAASDEEHNDAVVVAEVLRRGLPRTPASR